MMNCRQATELLSQSLDRPLTFQEKMKLRFHLVICSGCRNFSLHMGKLRSYSRTYVSMSDKDDEQ